MSGLTISVSQLNAYVAGRLEQDPFLRSVWIEGEIEKPTQRHGVCFFALAGEDARVDCLAFGEVYATNGTLLKHGTRVRVRGDVSVYRKAGRYRLAIRELRAAGIGELFLQMLERKKRLEEQGYFAAQRKRNLPAYPRHLAVVTSKEGAALQDILEVAKRRDPSVSIKVYPTLVQGKMAPESIAAAIRCASATSGADVLIIARGGGSAADLAAFNEEVVVRAVAESSIPTISAVGHETDDSLCDLAADRRAPTPSAAAEIAVPDRRQIIKQLEAEHARLQSNITQLLARRRSQLAEESRALRALAVTQRLNLAREQLRFFVQQGNASINDLLGRRRNELRTQATRLEALNPSRLLKSGYAVVLKKGLRVHEAQELSPGDKVELLFADGRRLATIAEEDSVGQ